MAHGTVLMTHFRPKMIRLEGGTLWQKICHAINSLFGHN